MQSRGRAPAQGVVIQEGLHLHPTGSDRRGMTTVIEVSKSAVEAENEAKKVRASPTNAASRSMLHTYAKGRSCRSLAHSNSWRGEVRSRPEKRILRCRTAAAAAG